MTALAQYIRLEASGRWREKEGDPWRDVLVSFGDATLVLSDFQERAFAHWALAALVREDRGDGLVRYRPAERSRDVLELNDAEMIDAITQVSRQAEGKAEIDKPLKNIRKKALLLLSICLVSALVWLAPSALRKRAVALIPEERAILMEREMVSRLSPQRCESAAGAQALSQLRRWAGIKGEVVVLEDMASPVARFPGGGLALSSAQLSGKDTDAATAASWLLLADRAGREGSGLSALFEDKPLYSVVNFLLYGKVEERDIAWLSGHLDHTPLLHSPALGQMPDLLAEKGVHAPGFLDAVRLPVAPATAAPVLDDQSWVALQAMCEER